MGSSGPKVLLLGATVVSGLGYYHFFGPAPTLGELAGGLPWWQPRGWATRWAPAAGLLALARGGWPGAGVPLALAGLPALGLTVLGLRRFSGAGMRSGILTLGLTLCLLAAYGYGSDGALWRFFSWRFPAVLLGLAALTSGALFAPQLLAAARRRSRAARAIALGGAFLGVFLLSTEITGTDESLRGNVSPWPLLPMFGLLIVGYGAAALHAAAGVGAWVEAQRPGRAGIAVGGGLAAVCGAAAVAWLAPEPPVSLLGAAALLCALSARRLAQRRGDAELHIATGLLMAALIFGSDRAAIAYLARARDVSAAQLIEALDEHRRRYATHPGTLDELVPELLERVPRARMGLIPHRSEEFRYTDLGDSYTLEFAAMLWVQCAYSPAYRFAEEEDSEPQLWMDDPEIAAGDPLSTEGDASEAAGSWTCNDAPPRFW